MKLLILIVECCFAVSHASMEYVQKAEDAVNVKVMDSSHVNREKREAGHVFNKAISSPVYTTRNKRAAVYTNRTKRATDVLSADDQCTRELGVESTFCRASYAADTSMDFVDFSIMCTTGLCSPVTEPTCQEVVFDEMTTCGNQKWCIAGECVFDEAAPVTSSDLCPQGDRPDMPCRIPPDVCTTVRVNNILQAFLPCCDHCKETPTTTTSTTTPTTTTSTTTPTTTTSTTTPTTTTSTTTPTTTTSTTTPTTTTSTTTPTTTTSTTTPTTTTSTTTPTTTTSTTTPTTTTSTTTPTTTTSTTTSTTTTTQRCTLFRYLACKCSKPPIFRLNRLRKLCRRCLSCQCLYSRRTSRKCRSCNRRILRKLCYRLRTRERSSK